jgi:aminocarboxymuconate-semialdehyde decarboxylase
MIIDVHTHIVPEKLPDFSRRAGGSRWPQMDPVDSCSCRVMIAGKNFRTVTDQCWSVERRLADMDGDNIVRQVLSPMPKLFSYWFEPADTLDFGRYVNEVIADMIRAAPDRFFGLGMVPLQDPQLAAKELEQIRSLGLHGIEIGTNIDGKSLADPMFLPFFQEAERRQLPIFIHALDPYGEERFIGPHFLENLLGFPQENTVTAATLITGGVIEQCPNLKVLFSHGGSGFALLLPRLDQGWRTMQPWLPKLPSEYSGNFYFDTLLYDAAGIRLLLDKFGPQRLMVGSDYPFVIRETPPGKYLNEVTGLTAGEREQIQTKTCLEFLGIK